jgi:hypothetical protein
MIKRIALVVLLMTVGTAGTVAAQTASTQQTSWLCDSWCVRISYPGGYSGYACESGFPEYGKGGCKATAYRCDIEECHIAFVEGRDGIRLAKLDPCETRPKAGEGKQALRGPSNAEGLAIATRVFRMRLLEAAGGRS